MAKQEKQEDKSGYPYTMRPQAQEQPPVTVETVKEDELQTVETVEIVAAEEVLPEEPLTPQTMPSGMVGTVVDSARAAASAAKDEEEKPKG